MTTTLPRGEDDIEARLGRVTVRLTNLQKVFFPELGLTKRDLLQYYINVSKWLLPHLRDRAMVMKRFPDGIHGEAFFMKRTPDPHPSWLRTCSIRHAKGNVIAFPMVQDLASLLWVVNLGCVDLNQWYSRCDDTDRPDYMHFDLDPVEGTPFGKVRETALAVRETLEGLGMKPLAKTSGASGIHVYAPIRRGPKQKEVWTVAKGIALEMARRHPRLVTVVFKVANRPKGRVLVDYNQNAWGRTLASVYSLRPTEEATVSTPVTWREVERGVEVDDFRIDNVPARLKRRGDLWKPLLSSRGRLDLGKLT